MRGERSDYQLAAPDQDLSDLLATLSWCQGQQARALAHLSSCSRAHWRSRPRSPGRLSPRCRRSGGRGRRCRSPCPRSSGQSGEPSRCMGPAVARRFDLRKYSDLIFILYIYSNCVLYIYCLLTKLILIQNTIFCSTYHPSSKKYFSDLVNSNHLISIIFERI